MPTILVTDPEQRAALAATRALGKKGYKVVTVGKTRGLAGVSRSCHHHERLLANPERDTTAYIAAIRAIVRRTDADVVLPVTDVASRVLLGAREELGVAVAGASVKAYTTASDKARLQEIAADCGIHTSRQIVLVNADNVKDVGLVLTAPLVVKPSNSVVNVGGVSVKPPVKMVDTLSELSSIVAQYPREAFPLLVQERTIGDGVGVFLFRTNGRTWLSLGHRRLREKPPSGGVSTYREAIKPPVALQQKCELLLDRLEYEGAAMIEFKQDGRTGEYLLMEINARLWGSLQLANDAGVDFASGLIAWTLGEPLHPQDGATIGTRTFWEFGEIDHAIALATKSRADLHVPPEVPVGWRAALQTLFDHRSSDRREIFRWSDPVPFLNELRGWLLRR